MLAARSRWTLAGPRRTNRRFTTDVRFEVSACHGMLTGGVGCGGNGVVMMGTIQNCERRNNGYLNYWCTIDRFINVKKQNNFGFQHSIWAYSVPFTNIKTYAKNQSDQIMFSDLSTISKFWKSSFICLFVRKFWKMLSNFGKMLNIIIILTN